MSSANDPRLGNLPCLLLSLALVVSSTYTVLIWIILRILLFYPRSLFFDFSVLTPNSNDRTRTSHILLLYWVGLLWLRTNSWKLKLIVERRKKITREQVQATKICNTVTWRTGCSELWRQGRGTFQSTTSHPRRTCTWD